MKEKNSYLHGATGTYIFRGFKARILIKCGPYIP